MDVIEYSVAFKDENGKVFGAIWDVVPELKEYTAIEFVLGEAEQQAVEENLEVVGMARANKTVFFDEELNEYETVYTSAFENVDINAHPPHRFRDIGNAE
jgi:hypothetical protein